MAGKMRNCQLLIWALQVLSIAVLVSDVMLLAGNALETVRKEAEEGHSVVFDCDLDYDPSKELYWVQDLQGEGLLYIIKLKRFQSLPQLFPAYRNRTDVTLESGTSLRIGRVRRSDKATDGRYYECQQPQGDKRKTRYELYVTYHPDPPTNIQVHGVRLYSFNVSCTAGDPGGLTQKLCLKHLQVGKNFICKEDINRGENVQFSVEGLDHNTAYQLCVYAENQLGNSGCGQASVVKVTTEAIGQFYASIRLLNVSFTSSDPNDQNNRELVNTMKKTLIGLLQPSHPDLTVEVTEIQEGSVILTMLFKGVQKEMETIKSTLKQAVTRGDLAHIVDPKYFYTFDHRTSDTSNRVWIAIVSTVVPVLVVLVIGGGLLVYCRRKKKTKEVTNMPEPMSTYFKSEDFKKLTETMKDSNICILHGQFGIGKSYAVTNFVKQVQDKTKYYVTWFIGNTLSNAFSITITNEETGLSLETVTEKLLAFAKELKESGRPVNIEQGETDVSNICEALKASKSECLLVFDDVQDINVIPRQLLNPWPELTVLITTMDETMGQHPDASHIPCLKMNGFSHSSPEGPSDVVSFLTSGSEDNVFKQTKESLLHELANQFACLPLGLSLAKSHILDSGTSVHEYLDHLKQQRNAMGRGNKDLSEPEKNIFAAVRLLLDRRMDEVSRQVLQLMAFLMPNNIPTAFLTEAYWHLKARKPNIDEFVKAVRKLSLGQVTEDKKTKMRIMTINQLTQRAVLDMLTVEDQNDMIPALVKTFLVLLIKDTREPRVGAFVSQLLPHLFSLLGHPALSLETILLVDKSKNRMLTALIRLHEVICYLFCQQRSPERAKRAAAKAKELCEHLCGTRALPSEDITNMCDMLKNEGRKRFQQDVYGQTVTRQLITSSNIDVLKLKVPQDITDTLALMAVRFQPLNKEQYRRLIMHGAALADDKVRAAYLIELVVSVFYTSGRILFYLHGDKREEYFNTAWEELFFSYRLSQTFASGTNVHLLNEMLSKRAGILYLLKERQNNPQEQMKDLSEVIERYNELIVDRNCYFEYGTLKKVQQDNFHAMICYRSIVDCYKRLTKLASSPKERKRFIQDHNTNAQKMIEYAEKQGTKDQQGSIIDVIELLPDVYNMRAQFIIDMYAAGFKDELPKGDDLRSAASWASKALCIESCKPLQEAKANQLLASVKIKAYKHKEPLHSDHEDDDMEVIDETEQLILNRLQPDNNDILRQADEHLQKSKEIYKDFPNATADISEANKLVEKLMECKQEEAQRRANMSCQYE